MNYNNDDLLFDFAERTKLNLEFIINSKKENPKVDVFETTQLINSLLGLLVFPFEHLEDQIPEKSIEDLKKDGWIIPEVKGNYQQVKTLHQLISYLRNSVSHFNIDFVPDSFNEIKSLIVCNKKWNSNTKEYDIPNWKAEITLLGLQDNVLRFIDLLLPSKKE